MLLTIFISISNTKIFASAENFTNDSGSDLFNDKVDLEYDIARVSEELFGDKSIQKSDYLYNFDDAADYVYVEYLDGGYAVFLKQTMELMEYSACGKLGYLDSLQRKYYGGPGSYLLKDNNYFVDITSNQSFYMSVETSQTYSNNIREQLLYNYSARSTNEIINYDYSIVDSNLYNRDDEAIDRTGNKPGLDTSSLIIIPETNGTYIPNYQYFLHNPRHGWNSTGTCGAVASQLLLSYHNYYSDRRIIDNSYLNGGTSNPYQNPNLCEDPMSMTSYTLGTRGYLENGSDDANSYFAYVVSKIPANCTTAQVRNGINSILSERNQEISGTINYTLGSKTGGWFFGNLAVNTSGITSEINAGRPSIILMQQSLGGADHYVVAYGYCNYTYPGTTDSYLGFITHFGWSSSDINVWINSAWCYGYVTLNINHTHNYYKVGPIGGDPCRIESKCSVCEHRTDGYISFEKNNRYVERKVLLPQNGYLYKDYIISFKTAGNKLFQTFGSKDTKLYLFDSEYNQLAYNDDGGSGYNSLFSYSVEENKEYILRVKFYNTTTIDYIKIGITPSDWVYSEYENIWHIMATNPGFSWTSALNTTKVICFTPESSGTYTLQTSSSDNIDTYLYLVDPTVTDACLYDDDSAGNLQALITTDLVANRRYFIVVSAYNIVYNSGGMNLHIRKIS